MKLGAEEILGNLFIQLTNTHKIVIKYQRYQEDQHIHNVAAM
jgi:hypothetical protein